MNKTSATVFLVLAKIGNLFLVLISARLFFQWLGTEQYGVYTYVQTFAAYLIVFDIGLWIGVQKRLTEATARQDHLAAERMARLQIKYGWWMGGISALAFIGFGALFPLLKHDPKGPSLALFAYAALCYLASTYNAGCQYILAATERFGKIAKINTTQSVLSAAFAIALAYRYRSPESIALGMALGAIAAAVMAHRVTKPSSISLEGHTRELLKDVVPIGLRGYPHRLAAMIGRNADRTVVGSLDFSQVTFYSFACKVPEVLSDIVTPMISTTVPQLTRSQDDPHRFSHLVERNALIAAGIGCSFILMPAAFGHSALYLWLKLDMKGLDVVVLLMGVYRVFELFYATMASPFYATGQVQRLIVFSTFNGLVTAAGTYFAFVRWGLVGVGVMNLTIGFAQFLPLLLVVRKLAGPTLPFARISIKTLSMILASLAVAWSIHTWLDRGLLQGHEKLALLFGPLACLVWISVLCGTGLCPVPDPILRRLPARLRPAGRVPKGPEPDLARLIEQIDIPLGDLEGPASPLHDIGESDPV